VTDAVGYRFHYDPESKQFAHPGALVLLQPNGHVSRYLYGLDYPPNDMRLGLLEASQGKLISTTDQVLLFCYRYDPHQGKYVVMANRVMEVGAAFSALLLGGFLGLFWLRERKKSRVPPSLPSRGDGSPTDGAPSPMETRT
jgi:protein SCO1/2